MHKEPEWSALPPDTPPTIRLLLRRCLAKDRKRRLQDIGDARIELDEAIADPSGSSLNLAAAALAAGDRRPLRAVAPWVLTCLLAVALAAGWFMMRTPQQPQPIRKLTLTIDAEQAIPIFAVAPFAISPDASRVVFVGPGTPFTSLYLRSLDQVEALPLPNTDGAHRPFFSPDGQWIAYVDDDRLMRISARGGPPNTLCEATSFRGGAWGEDGTIVFTPEQTGGLFRVLAAGGTPEPLTTVPEGSSANSHRNASLLPDGRGVLFTACGTTDDWEKVAVWVYSNETGEQRELIRGGTDGRYVPTGHLVYRRETTLMAATFDLDTLEVTGPSVPVLEGIAGGGVWNPARFTFAQDGTAVYMPGTGSAEMSIVWTDLQGRDEPMSDRHGEYRDVALSPNDDRVALTVHEDTDDDIWILERQRDILRPLTFDPADDGDPVWSPDGRWIVFSSDRGSDADEPNLYRIAADFTGTPQRLTTAEYPHFPDSVSPDGTTIAYMEIHPESNGDLYFLHVDDQGVVGEPEPFAVGPKWQWSPAFSPDGRWIAYCSAQSGRAEVYVRAVSGGQAPVQVSTDGGFRVAWSPTEDRLFYVNAERMHAVRYTIDGQTMTPDLPEPLFAAGTRMSVFADFNVASDGLRFCRVVPTDDDGERDQPVVILNWFRELAEKLPTTD
jgi:serine/threonine-protein kinase